MTLPQTYNNKKKGVARFIFKKSENVATTHCCMHNLNLRHFVLIGHALRPPNLELHTFLTEHLWATPSVQIKYLQLLYH